ISRRFADINIIIHPVHVQGDLAAGEIVQAIEEFNREFPQLDVIILARGGGSLEDLWPFNEESVARAISASKIPIISAVGHEVDYTISDFTSDLRAPTPSAAAELVVRNKIELIQKIGMLESKLTSFINYKVTSFSMQIEKLSRSKALTQPTRQYEQSEQEIDYCHTRLVELFRHYMELAAKQLSILSGKLDTLSPLDVLKRGYSIAWKLPENRILKYVKNIGIDDKVKVKLFRGEIFCRVEECHKEA
ncbi:exodeoxyribonuclease VII large subunit, partial [bacterium]|nr:exodeoxyribonuclease VII large subunit [bacterium]